MQPSGDRAGTLGHISTDDLERYQFGQLKEAPSLVEIKQHLSECLECADRMLAVERFIRLVRAGVFRGGFGREFG